MTTGKVENAVLAAKKASCFSCFRINEEMYIFFYKTADSRISILDIKPRFAI